MTRFAGIFALALAISAGVAVAAKAQNVNPRPLTSFSPADNSTCLLDRRATALEIIAACTRLIDSARPNDNAFMLSDAYNERGRAHAGLMHNDEALENFATAILLDADNGDAYFNRATIYMERKNYPLALKDFDAALEANPMDGLALFDRAVAKLRLGDKTGSDADFDEAIAIDPRYEERRARIAP